MTPHCSGFDPAKVYKYVYNNIMKRFIYISGLLLLVLSSISCLKDAEICKNRDISVEEPDIINYNTSQGINAIRDPSGVYYQVLNYGSGATPTGTSIVSVKYTGKLLDGTIFTQENIPTDVDMKLVIQGWKIGLPLIQKGGIIKLIIPSSLAYGCNGFATVPGNAILVFQIELVDVH
jgi:FKBP-type peptidyl-prolyl cis-trans isomerase